MIKKTAKLLLIAFIIQLCALAVYAGTTDGTKIAIVLKEEVNVAKDVITLGDIAESVSPENIEKDIVIMSSPRPSFTKTVFSSMVAGAVRRRYREAKINVEGECVVSLKHKVLTFSELTSKAKSFLKNEFSGEGFIIESLREINREFYLPLDVEIKFSNNKITATGTVNVYAEIFQDGRRIEMTVIPFAVKRKIEAYFVNKRIERGVKLKEEDIYKKETLVAGMEEMNYITDIQELENMITLTFIEKDSPVSPRNLREKHAVTRGQVVTVKYINNGIELTAKAQSLETGHRGDKIRLRNLESQKIIFAEITNENEFLIR